MTENISNNGATGSLSETLPISVDLNSHFNSGDYAVVSANLFISAGDNAFTVVANGYFIGYLIAP